VEQEILYDEQGNKFKDSFVKISNESSKIHIRITMIANATMKGLVPFNTQGLRHILVHDDYQWIQFFLSILDHSMWLYFSFKLEVVL